jgi:hypothetical protein
MSEHLPRQSQPKSRQRLWLATVGLLVLLPCLGLAVSAAHLKARQAGILSRWQPLGAVPAGGVDIVAGDLNVVYVRTAAGKIYGCRHSGRRPDPNCWMEAQEPLNVERHAASGRQLYTRQVKPPQGTVVDTLVVTAWYGGDAFEARYVLLQDGTVWKWKYDVGAIWTLSILILGPLVGFVLGVVAAVVLWVRARRRPHRNWGPHRDGDA